MKLTKFVSALAVVVSLAGVSGQVVSAAEVAPSLASAEDMPTSPVAKKGDKIFVVYKDTKKQRVNVVNAKNHKTGKTVKMCRTFTVKSTKKVSGHRIYRIGSQRQWLRAADVTKD